MHDKLSITYIIVYCPRGAGAGDKPPNSNTNCLLCLCYNLRHSRFQKTPLLLSRAVCVYNLHKWVASCARARNSGYVHKELITVLTYVIQSYQYLDMLNRGSSGIVYPYPYPIVNSFKSNKNHV